MFTKSTKKTTKGTNVLMLKPGLFVLFVVFLVPFVI